MDGMGMPFKSAKNFRSHIVGRFFRKKHEPSGRSSSGGCIRIVHGEKRKWAVAGHAN